MSNGQASCVDVSPATYAHKHTHKQVNELPASGAARKFNWRKLAATNQVSQTGRMVCLFIYGVRLIWEKRKVDLLDYSIIKSCLLNLIPGGRRRPHNTTGHPGERQASWAPVLLANLCVCTTCRSQYLFFRVAVFPFSAASTFSLSH